MIVKAKQNLKPITHESQHYKLYKDGKHLVTAGIASLSVIGFLAVSSEPTIHADINGGSSTNNAVTITTNNAPAPASTNSSVSSTIGDQVNESQAGKAGTITQPVNVDHSQLNNAVNQARHAGLTVNQQPTTVQTVNQDQVDATKQIIQNNEDSQAHQIQGITNQKLTEDSNYQNFNGSKGDTTQLDAKVKEAQSIPGLTVIHDQDQTTVKSASDTQGIQDAVNAATKSNNDQAQAIQNAIDTQKQKQTDYEKQKAGMANQIKNNPGQQPNYNKRFTGDQVSYTDSNTWTNLPPKTIPTGNGKGITLSGASNVTDANSAKNYHIIGYDSGNTLQNDHIIQKISWDGYNATVISGNGHDGDLFPNAYPIGDSGSYNQAITVQSGAKILIPGAVHLADGTTRNLVVQATNSNSEGNQWIVLWNSNGAVNAVSWPQTSHTRNSLGTSLQYWVQGQENEGFLWSQVVSDIDLGQTDSIWDIGESVAVLGLGGGLHLDSGNNQGERINIKASNMLGYPGTFGKDATWGAALNGFSSAPDGVAAYAVYSNSFGHTVSNDPANAYATGVALADFGNSMNLSIPTAPKSEVHYHYNPVTVTKTSLGDIPLSYQLHDLNVKTTPSKNWTYGIQSVNNKVGINDDIVHARIDMNYLKPSQIDGGLTSLKVSDDYSKFANNVEYVGANVYENDQDVTSDYTITNDGQQVIATRNNPSQANGGKISLVVAFKIKPGVKTGTTFENSGSGTINDQTAPTNDVEIVTYQQESEKHWVEGEQVVDGRVYVDGSVAHAKVTTTLPDPTQLITPLTNMSIKDDYSRFAKDVDLKDVEVLENGKSVTNQYNIEKGYGYVIATRKDPTMTPGGNAQLLLTFNIHKDVPSGTKLENAGSSTINNHTVKTNVPWIETYLPNPTKDVVISVDNQKSLNGQKIELGQNFDYKLVGANLPVNVISFTEYGFHDDYDQIHDQYNGGYIVFLNNDVTLKDGTVLKKHTDVTKYTTQVVDYENGKVNIEFDKDFLSKIDTTKTSFGATTYLKMKRIKSGTVHNKYTNTINNMEFTSNEVTTTTDEPKKPEIPQGPKTPVTTPKESTPMQTAAAPVMATITPALAQQNSKRQELPQTGNNENGAAIVGFAGMLLALGALSLKKKKRWA